MNLRIFYSFLPLLFCLVACTGEGSSISEDAFVNVVGGPPTDKRAIEMTAKVLHSVDPNAKTEPVNPRSVILGLFDPQSSVCAEVLPKKVKKKLVKNGKKFAPVAVQKQIDSIPEQGTRLPNSDVALLLNTVTHKSAAGVSTTIRVPSSADFDATAFVIRSRGEFAYNLDCNGYFNAAVTLSLPTTVEAVWSSSSGQASFNGHADFAGSASGAAVVATVSGNLKSGGSIGRNVRFTEVQAIALGTAELTGIADPNPLTVKELRQALTSIPTLTAVRACCSRPHFQIPPCGPMSITKPHTW